ncbi:hypothetical protein ACFVWG_26550 [Kribbella sp. NPDC058245]|uniref:hypothetical protein n=1 Tax=Kribbella sp. NPDC058245 TaxID=3346399 RepID=UPI0036E9FD34
MILFVDLEERVAAMAVRVGHDAPPINRIDGSEQQPCAFTLPPGPLGPALVVHSHLEEKPEPLQDFLIAQALVSDRLGINREYKTLIWSIRIGLIVLIGVIAGVGSYIADTYGAVVLVLPIVAFVVVLAFCILPIAIWSRHFARRQDDRLIQILGREQLIEALRLDATTRPRPANLFWIRMGMRPRSIDRLRRLT